MKESGIPLLGTEEPTVFEPEDVELKYKTSFNIGCALTEYEQFSYTNLYPRYNIVAGNDVLGGFGETVEGDTRLKFGSIFKFGLDMYLDYKADYNIGTKSDKTNNTWFGLLVANDILNNSVFTFDVLNAHQIFNTNHSIGLRNLELDSDTKFTLIPIEDNNINYNTIYRGRGGKN